MKDVTPRLSQAIAAITDRCETTGEVAAYLRAHGFKGLRSNPVSCPLAVCFSLTCDIPTVRVAGMISAWPERANVGIPLAEVVTPHLLLDFMREFDDGAFPELRNEYGFHA